MEVTETKITLSDLPVGSRLHFRSKNDWRTAVISTVLNETVVLIVCSPTGRTYRLRRNSETSIFFDGKIPILEAREENWRENFTKYDIRW